MMSRRRENSTAGRRLAGASCFLYRWAGNRAVGAKDAAVTGFWPKQGLAAFTLVKEQAGIGGHDMAALVAAFGTGQLGGALDPFGRWFAQTIAPLFLQSTLGPQATPGKDRRLAFVSTVQAMA